MAVEVRAEGDSLGQAWLSARFTPVRRGFHLYDKDLPRGGIRGIGRPTLLELVPGSGVRASGPLRADRTPSPLVYAPLDLSLPVYPAGPVTLRLPIAWEGSGPRAVDLRFTYMACTASTCMPPVVGKQLRVTLPAHSSGR